MDKVTELLSNPAIRAGLSAVSPSLSLGVEAVLAIVSSLRRKPGVDELLAIIDDKLAKALRELATKNPPFFYKRELEIRAHQLLEIVMEWEKVR
jgi:hypothetical protein